MAMRFLSGRHIGSRGQRLTNRKRLSVPRRRLRSIECLEDRLLFAVVWVNRGSAADDSDNFAAIYGANQGVARQIVDQAINDWSEVIRDFDYDRDNDPTTNNTFRLILFADNSVSGDFGETFFNGINGFGQPVSAIVYMGSGGTDGWFFDPSPANHNEFTHIVNPFQASSTQPGNDFYRSILHQIGHAVGIAIEPGLALTAHLNFSGTDQVDPAPLFVFRNFGGQFGVSVTMTDYDGGNIYEGPVDPAFNRAPIHPNDLMNDDRTIAPPATRQLISDLDAMLLADAYGYQVTLPSALNVFIERDALDFNDTLQQATVLGSEDRITLRELSIFPAGDIDLFRWTAAHTGKLIVNSFFVNSVGNDLQLLIRDRNNNVIASSLSTDNDEAVVIPVVSQETYYIEIAGATPTDINNYSLEIENFAAPVPASILLDPDSDSGRSDLDAVTYDTTPRLLIESDLLLFADSNRDGSVTPSDIEPRILTPAEAAAGNVAGLAVEVFVTNTQTGAVTRGFANPLPSTTTPYLFEFVVPDPAALANGKYLVAAATVVVDNQVPHQRGRTVKSEAFLMTVDVTAPATQAIDMIAASDTGTSPTDDVTSITTPTFAGTAPANSLLRLYANGSLVGTTMVGSDASDGIVGNGLGSWGVTSAALKNGIHTMTYTLEDLAGNLSIPSAPLLIEIDTVAPNTPYLDLVSADDSGRSDEDNVTNVNTLLLSAATHDAGPVPPHLLDPNLIFRIYARQPQGPEILLFDSSAVIGGLTDLTQIFTTDDLLNGATNLIALPDGMNNLKLEVEDRAGNISEDFLLSVVVDTVAPLTQAIDMIAESDTGTSATDNVTSITTPTFAGTAPANSLLRLYANGSLVGTTMVGSDESDGIIGNGLGSWGVTSAALKNGIHTMTYTLEDLAGNLSVPSAPLLIEIDTVAPNTPYLDLVSADDSGRSDEDNVTNVNTLLLSAATHDAGPVPPHLLDPNLIFRIYARTPEDDEALIFDSSAVIGDLTDLTQIFTTDDLLNGATNLIALPDGTNNLKLEVEDRAGNISADFLLSVVVDTVAPPAPTLRFDPATTDSGLVFDPATSVDGITHVTAPGFVGQAEANAVVRLYADITQDDAIDVSDLSVGLDQALPRDGNDAFPAGQYRIIVTSDLNNPDAGFPRDGFRQMGVTAEDLAGNVSTAAFLDIVIDSVPPTVTEIEFANGQSVFAPKPQAGPTPRIDSIFVTLNDSRPQGLPPGFDVPGVDLALVTNPGSYQVIGDHSGRVLIDSVNVVTNLNGVVTVEIRFDSPLPDDRFTLLISDAIRDPAGNQLDGDTRPSAPGLPADLFPSGDGLPGGTFAGRFTVDSRPEIAVVSQATVYVDINGNFVFDTEGQDNDATNRDFIYQFALISDAHFAGNFSVAGANASGFDKMGAYGLFSGKYSFIIDTDDNGTGDVASVMPAQYQVNGIPVAGDFSALKDGDEIGLFDGKAWYVDLNGNNVIDFGERIAASYNGLPVVGDFNGDGSDDFAVYNNSTNVFTFDTDRNGTANFTWSVRGDLSRYLGPSGFTDRPVVGDLNLDGIDDIGLWVKGRGGMNPENSGEFFLWLSDQVNVNPANVFNEYSPDPLGNDLYARFGSDLALPLFGNFDPPITGGGGTTTGPSLTNRRDRFDVNDDGRVTPLDALRVLNVLNQRIGPFGGVPAIRVLAMTDGMMADTNADGEFTPLDALLILNQLRDRAAGLTLASEGESGLGDPGYAAAVDIAFADLLDDDEDDDNRDGSDVWRILAAEREWSRID